MGVKTMGMKALREQKARLGVPIRHCLIGVVEDLVFEDLAVERLIVER